MAPRQYGAFIVAATFVLPAIRVEGASSFSESSACFTEIEQQTQEPGSIALLQKHKLHKSGVDSLQESAVDLLSESEVDLSSESDADLSSESAVDLSSASEADLSSESEADLSSESEAESLQEGDGDRANEAADGELPSNAQSLTSSALSTNIVANSHAGLGSTVAVDQEGFFQVARLKSTQEMEAFLRRSLEDMGLRIVNEEAFRTVVPWFSGESGTGSFGHFKGKVLNMLGQSGSWVTDEEPALPVLSGKTAPLTETGYTALLALQSNLDMLEFAERIATVLGCSITDPAGIEKSIPNFSGEEKFQTLANLKMEILLSSQAPGYWASDCRGPV